ncbi:pyridoxamine 5'-phosphate oxidase-domain-containing protein [Coniella lustricola]|uniref:Pyridoxamine 5'-phosphate oxidase-domain-containing protein n=1 Tax=Coniella lustricola TaxID=2025994 RepID=A0A2T2ZWQ8_9PEZI|nr:pyridoxamine 5'-phosphate oxidase-domain-containing protein [Coniella lustricola]
MAAQSSSSSQPASTPAAAPWRAQFLSDISQMDQPSFTFTSLHHSSSGVVPRGRTCIYRGLWASLPPNDKNTAKRNPNLFESDMPVLTSDARMAKVPELYASLPSSANSNGNHASDADVSHSGGGGPVEAMFWAVPTGTQWRIRGRAWVLAANDISGSSEGAQAVRTALLARMRAASDKSSDDSNGNGNSNSNSNGQQDGDWDWEREVNAQFGNLGPGMRGSFKNPSPGTPRANAPKAGEGLGQKVGDELLEDEIARRNFRVVVIVPEEVDLVNLKDPADQRRWLYTYVGEGAQASKPGAKIEGEWEVVELWP